jgi:hypothetical protein
MQPKNWIQTYNGSVFDFDNIERFNFQIEDFAHSLSLLCRYNGHCTKYYSVAEHLLRCSYEVPVEYQFEALMHDVSEAYLSDMPRPLKKLMPEYQALEKRVEKAIANQYDLPFPMSPVVKECDNKMLLTEMRNIMRKPPYEWENYGVTPYSQVNWINFEKNHNVKSWQNVRDEYIYRFHELYKQHLQRTDSLNTAA